ncbi:unnamed protein product [Brachionus calyciflorus]|uniref:Uncharacterized protein n=1 Tax=Brachionus calyciflorus TaxID=104777 RepID=A0A814LQ31_9BILA|nr:unnamed protein product [Brachionus calyciflorus]
MMKHSRKWMVVPFDINYNKNNNVPSNVLFNESLPSETKILLYIDLLARKAIKNEKQLPVEISNEKSNEQITTEKLEDDRVKKLYHKIMNDISKMPDAKVKKKISNNEFIDSHGKKQELNKSNDILNESTEQKMDFENIDSNDEDYGNQLNKLRRNKPRIRLFKPSNNISMNKVSGRKIILNASINNSLLEPKTSKVKKKIMRFMMKVSIFQLEIQDYKKHVNY